MTKSSAAAEPSMEEILASIRRIISDGEEAAAREADSTADAGSAQQDPGTFPQGERREGGSHAFVDAAEEDFELTDEMLEAPETDEPATQNDPTAGAPEAEEAIFVMPTVEPVQSDVIFESGNEVLEAHQSAAPAESTMQSNEDKAGPTSETWQTEPDSAAAAKEDEPLLSPETDAKVAATFSRLANTILMGDARTLDDLVKEMLRPMLKEWLDDNLPHLVERLVREEIERVSRGRG